MGKVEIVITKGYQCFLHGRATTITVKADERSDIDEKLEYFIRSIR